MYVSEKAEPINQDALNQEGGIDPKDDFEMYRAEANDLITLPGGTKADAKDKRQCKHPKIKMYVTTRMCCALWDNSKVKRPWKKST